MGSSFLCPPKSFGKTGICSPTNPWLIWGAKRESRDMDQKAKGGRGGSKRVPDRRWIMPECLEEKFHGYPEIKTRIGIFGQLSNQMSYGGPSVCSDD